MIPTNPRRSYQAYEWEMNIEEIPGHNPELQQKVRIIYTPTDGGTLRIHCQNGTFLRFSFVIGAPYERLSSNNWCKTTTTIDGTEVLENFNRQIVECEWEELRKISAAVTAQVIAAQLAAIKGHQRDAAA